MFENMVDVKFLMNEEEFDITCSYEGFVVISLRTMDDIKKIFDKKVQDAVIKELYIEKSIDEENEFDEDLLGIFDIDDRIEILESFFNRVNKNGLKEKIMINVLDMNDNLSLVSEKVEKPIFDLMSISNIDDLLFVLKNNKFKKNDLFYTKYSYGDYSTYEEIVEMIEYIVNIKKFVQHYNLSPLEQAIFVYDLVREREYKKSIGKDGYSDSRSLVKVCSSDEIVCYGFANIYSTVLNELGINTELVAFEPTDDSKVGHASALVHINDDKHNIHTTFECDPTWDCKEKDNDEYLDSYKYFGLPFGVAVEIKKRRNLSLRPGNVYGRIKTNIDRFLNIKELGAPTVIILNDARMALKKMIDYAITINDFKLLEECEELLNSTDIDYIEEFFKNSVFYMSESRVVPKSAFKNALAHVRKIEHCIDPVKYDMSMEKINEIVNGKYEESPAERLLMAIFGKLPQDENIDDRPLEQARMELLHVLKKMNKEDLSNPAIPRRK